MNESFNVRTIKRVKTVHSRNCLPSIDLGISYFLTGKNKQEPIIRFCTLSHPLSRTYVPICFISVTELLLFRYRICISIVNKDQRCKLVQYKSRKIYFCFLISLAARSWESSRVTTTTSKYCLILSTTWSLTIFVLDFCFFGISLVHIFVKC